LSFQGFVDLARWIRAAIDIVGRQASIGKNAVDPDAGIHCLAVLQLHVDKLLPVCALVQQVIDPTPIREEFSCEEVMTRDVPVATTALRELRSQIQQCKDRISAAVSQVRAKIGGLDW
jgi:hypothetical protein